jgi:tetratricopeptide (TPR) repeat protein
MRKSFLVIVAIILVYTPLAFSKEWYEFYEDGKKAIDKGNCAQGEKDMKEAARKKSGADLKARPYGTMTQEYIPYFYLAKCAVDRGDYSAADLYLGELKRIDMSQSSKAGEYRTMAKTVEEKMKIVKSGSQTPSSTGTKTPTGTPTGTTTTPTTTTPTTTTTNNTGTSNTGTKPPDINTQNIQSTQQSVMNRALENARNAYESGNYDQARDEANRVLMLDRNNKEANRLLSQISSRENAEIASRAKQQRIDEARKAMNRGEIMTAESIVVQLRAEYPTDRTLESLANEIQKKKLAQLQNQNEEETQSKIERQVVRSYFEGRYEGVIQLAEIGLAQHPDSWRLLFFKGCAHAALGFLDNKSKDSQLSQAKESFRKARAANGQISKPVQISPKIWDIYKDS